MTDGSFLPIVLWRRGALPFAELSRLVPAATWSRLDEATAAGMRASALAERLSDALYHAVPTVSEDRRRDVLAVRRDIHNGRIPAAGRRAAVRPVLSPEHRADLDAWVSERAREQSCLAEADTSLARELPLARTQLAALAEYDDFRTGIQLSGPELARNIGSYAATVGTTGTVPKRLHKTESTLLSYLFRMSLKPSPFASFTEVGAHPWQSATSREGGPRVRSATISRGVATWMAREVGRSAEFAAEQQVRLNNTLAVTDAALTYFHRGPDGTDRVFGAERFCTIPRSEAVDVVLAALSDGPRSASTVREALVAAGAEAPQASAFLDKLIGLGLCEAGFGIPDQTPDYVGKLATRLTGSAELADLFVVLDQVEREFPTAGPDDRDKHLAQLDQQLTRFTGVLGLPQPPPGVVRTMIYEDVGRTGPSQSWQPDLLDRNKAEFGILQRLLPVLDDGTVERLGLYRFFAAQYGDAGYCPDLLDFYRGFASLDTSAMTGLMVGAQDEAAQRVRALRQELRTLLAAQLHEGRDAAAIALDSALMRHFVDELPEFLPAWTSAGYRIQFAPAEQLAVLNGVTRGHGTFFSRFCELLEPQDTQGWSLRDALAEDIARRTPRQADLCAVLDMNFNLHPRLTPFEVVYPGSVADPSSGGLTLRDLALRADPVRRSVVVVAKADGRPIDLVPMNFLFPAAGPMLYRFLFLLTTTGVYRGGLWDQVRADGLDGDLRRFPRLSLGDIVLERQSWRLPGHEFAQVCAAPGDASALLAVEEWRARAGLPRECFFRWARTVNRSGAPADWTDEVRAWALSARRARQHKPHYLDFRNPFLVHILGKQARAARDQTAVLSECLPSSADYLGAAGANAAEEFIVEYYA